MSRSTPEEMRRFASYLRSLTRTRATVKELKADPIGFLRDVANGFDKAAAAMFVEETPELRRLRDAEPMGRA